MDVGKTIWKLHRRIEDLEANEKRLLKTIESLQDLLRKRLCQTNVHSEPEMKQK